MKIRISSQHGGVLLVSLSLTIILGTALASYLKLVEYQNRSVSRSQFWNSAIPAAEAGLEEALSHLNYLGDNNRATNGWVYDNGNYKISRAMGNSRYEVSIDSMTQPSITSVGYVTEPISGTELKRTILVQTTRFGAGMRGIITRRGLTMNGNTRIDSFDSEDPNYSTFGRYDAAKAKDNGYAGAVSGSVYAEGEGIYGYAGTGATGTASGNIGSKTWLGSNTGVEPGRYQKDLNLSFLDATVPFNGGAQTPVVNQNLTITNYTYLTTQTTSTTYPSPEPASGITTNYQTTTTATKPFSWSGTLVTNTASTTSTTIPAAGTYVGNVVTRVVVTGHGVNATTTTFYDYVAITGYTYTTCTYTYNTITTNATTITKDFAVVTGTGNYQVNALSLAGQQDYLITGDTVLFIDGDFTMFGQSEIHILPGASLTVYVSGKVNLSGNGIMNLSQDSTKFTLRGLPSCTDINISGNASFTGSIYAPSADLSLNGSGTTIYDIVGAVVSNTAYFNGNFNFHYDERLGRNGGKPQFKVAYWTEI
jgi:hypothetical protein